MGYPHYSEEFKKAAIQKVLARGPRSVEQIAREVGASSDSVYAWLRKSAKASGMKKPDRRPQDWSAAEKLKAVIEHEGLAPEKRGEFLRREGLHSDHVESWKKSMEAGLEPERRRLSAEERAERAAERKKIEELERELRRKDKALAETTALLVLKKKADLIWGTGENE
jgi:transposase